MDGGDGGSSSNSGGGGGGGEQQQQVPLPENSVLVSIPRIYTNANEAKSDIRLSNVRAIKYEQLMKQGDLFLATIWHPDHKQADICNHLVDEVLGIIQSCNTEDRWVEHGLPKEMGTLDEMRDGIVQLMLMLRDINASSDKVQMNERYRDLSPIESFSFDMIRRYECAPSGLLICAEPATYDGMSFYSQAANVVEVRRAMNDTDYNRVQHLMQMVEKAILFKTNCVPRTTQVYVNLTLNFMLMALKSQPMANTSEDLVPNLILVLIDTIVRTRIIAHWHADPIRRKLMQDIAINYPEQHAMVRLSTLESARDRASAMVNLVRQCVKESNALTENLDYENYIRMVGKNTIQVDGEAYYDLGLHSIKAILEKVDTAQMLTLTSKLTKSMRDEFNDDDDDDDYCEGVGGKRTRANSNSGSGGSGTSGNAGLTAENIFSDAGMSFVKPHLMMKAISKKYYQQKQQDQQVQQHQPESMNEN